MDIKIRNKCIEVKYCVSNGLVIFITDNWGLRIFEIRRYRCSGGSILKVTMLVNKFFFKYKSNFYEMPFVVCFRIDKWTNSMLSITSSQQRSIVQWTISIVEFISLSL